MRRTTRDVRETSEFESSCKCSSSRDAELVMFLAILESWAEMRTPCFAFCLPSQFIVIDYGSELT